MIKAIIGLAALAAAIAYGVHWATEQGTSAGPKTVTVEMPDPMGGGGGGGNGGGSGGQVLLP
jgi:hypothetical protein